MTDARSGRDGGRTPPDQAEASTGENACSHRVSDHVVVLLSGEEAVLLRALLHDRFDGPRSGPRGCLDSVDQKLANLSVLTASLSPLLAHFWGNDRSEVRGLQLPDSWSPFEQGVAAPGLIDVALDLTEDEACVLFALLWNYVWLSGLGETLTGVADKLKSADAPWGSLVVTVGQDGRLRVDGFTKGRRPSELPED